MYRLKKLSHFLWSLLAKGHSVWFTLNSEFIHYYLISPS